MEDHAAMLALLEDAGLIGGAATVTPLTGGVSCDVWRVDSAGRAPVAVKRALPRLRVAAEWLVPVERIDSEVGWLRRVHALDAALVPQVLGHWPADATFAMRFLPDRPVWRDELAAGRVDPAFAARVGTAIAGVHAATAHSAADARAFANDALFEALRIAPFLRHVAERTPPLRERLSAMADDLAARKVALVHGDVSPKNILVGPAGPVLLDAECATYGDPAFDLAFCTTHLLLKQVWLPDHAPALADATAALLGAYFARIDWEPADALSLRAGELTAALLLARVDGKSPVGYLDDALRARVRDRARRLLARPALPVERLANEWHLEEIG